MKATRTEDAGGPVTLGEVLDAVAAGALTPAGTARLALSRIRELDPGLRAMVSVDTGAGLGDGPHRGALRGACVGIKDVLDVAGLPTLAASPARVNNPPAAADAAIVRQLRAAGATILGKTVTTQLATMDPAPTRNPWCRSATPGGSSSGSAVAVAAGLLPLAVGTQTAGSVCRPAAYCGVSAIKPTYGLLPTDGMTALAPSFDTLGLFARTVGDIALAFEALHVADPVASNDTPAHGGSRLRLGVLPPAFYHDADGASLTHLGEVARAAATADMEVVEVPPPAAPQRVLDLHHIVMCREAWDAHSGSFAPAPHLFGPHIADVLRTGATVTDREYDDARAEIAALRAARWSQLAGVDAVLTLPAPGPAPDRSTTGSAAYLIPWTAFHGPLVVVPGERDAAGLPLATMVAAAPGADRTALAVATRLARHIDRLPTHAPPATRPPAPDLEGVIP
ncbi:amidase [Nocardia sp. NPDC024068]|uniref:amidase n=1 Tax=Nocardia sp. NPDC024068 TaxID=3157197 RepID=UPI0033E50582